MPAALTPYLPNLLGGMLIGLAAGGLRLFTGQVAGVSGILKRAAAGPQRGWRLAFLGGLLLPGLALVLAGRGLPVAGLDGTPIVLLVPAGLLVGLGTGIGHGCTSGHGICGLANLSRRSLVAVLVFMAVAAFTVFLLRHGGRP